MIRASEAKKLAKDSEKSVDDFILVLDPKIRAAAEKGLYFIEHYDERTCWRNDDYASEEKNKIFNDILIAKLNLNGYRCSWISGQPYYIPMDDNEYRNTYLRISWEYAQ